MRGLLYLLASSFPDYSLFPPEEYCAAQYHLAVSYERELSERLMIGERCAGELADTIELRQIWWAMWWVSWPAGQSCWDPDVPITVQRREWADRVREMVGDTAYYSADWPPALPVWWFRRD